MTVRQVIIVAPISTLSLITLKEQGYDLYAYCEGIKQTVQIRSISPDCQVEIGHWGYVWIPIGKIRRVIGIKPETDRRSYYSQVVTQTIAPTPKKPGT
jgi:hypothetical protein